MNQEHVNVLLIEDSPEYAQLVQQWLSTGIGGIPIALNWADSLANGLDRLARGHVDVVLLDLGLPDSDGPGTFFSVRRHTPAAPVIILSTADNESQALSLVQKGAEDYLVKSTCNAEILLRALRFAMARYQWHAPAHPQAGATQGRVVGVMGCKGGVGGTTIACSLACELAKLPQQKVLLMDLDTIAGMVPFHMNLEPGNSIVDAIRKMDQMDLGCWESIVTRRGPPELSVLPLDGPNWEADDLTAASVATLLAWTRPIYDRVVADLGRCRRLSLELAEDMDEICLIATPAIPALFEAKRAIGALLKSGFAADRLRMVLNQVGKFSPFSGSELQKVFGVAVQAKLPADAHEMENDTLAMRLPRSQSAFGKEMAVLAQRLAGLPEKPPGWAPWSALAGRFLKNGSAHPQAGGSL
jgi:Flp pilus assembly CpaE family ATPase